MKLPLPPNKLDSREDFINKMDAFVSALPKCIDELQAYIEESVADTSTKLGTITSNLNEIQRLYTAITKSEQATREVQLIAAQGITEEWVPGRTYFKGNLSYSTLNGRVYKAREQISNNEDPSLSTSWSPAALSTGLFIDKAYAPRTLQVGTHWLILKEGVYTLPEAYPNEQLCITNNTNYTCTFEVANIRGVNKVLQIASGESRTLQYSGNVYGWI